MKLKNILSKAVGLLMLGVSVVSLPVLIYQIAEWGFSLEDALGLGTFVIAPAIVGGVLTYVGNKNLKIDIKKKQERNTLQIAQKSGGRITVMELSVKSKMNLEEAQDCLNRIQEAGLADIFHAENGSILYEFPELLTDKEKGNSQKLI